MIPDSFIQELLARIDVVDVVERHVPLKKAGANYSACCPFHSEKTPSFTVSPSKQFYHCFGCGAHGSAIGFLMEYSGLGFVDAVEELAASVGLKVPQQAAAQRHDAHKIAPLTDYMARAAKYYREQLKASPRAIDYLRKRGLSGEIAARYGLGYAPDGWQNLESIFPGYGKAQEPAECGLVIDNEQGRRYDRFRDRIMFPILDQRGNVIGFGGRVLDKGEPKYLNSPETPLFEKGRELYGLPQARKAIREANAAIVVEGYMDVVGLAQLGVENVVASLGTATTGMHLQKLFKLTDRIVFCFDRDAAGDKAAWRAMEIGLEHLADNKSIEILQMPGNQDPDEFIREHGKDAFLAQARSATRLSEFMVKQLERQTKPYTAEGRAQLIHAAKPLLQRVSAPVLRVQLTKAIADLAQLSQSEVEAACELKPLSLRRSAPPRATQRPAARSIEHQLLENILHHPLRATRLPLDLVAGNTPEEAALRAIADAIDHGELLVSSGPGAAQMGMLIEYFRGSEHEATLTQYVSALASGGIDEQAGASAGEAMEIEFNDALERLRQAHLTREIAMLTHKERNGGLSVEERRLFADLLAQKNAAAAKPRQRG
ncbi:DNA primase [Sterolibacterium denitrificans]|uniref:DNA primase n=1 Tax=Sterolibacterium denitrificans TaxID=157592 RepID=A0A7Z7MTW9_9PROT|nr:DNA primase [Sterolibacterium denitrificans]SMB21038.1 DNA primase [Sterolibacterium denitrificans]